MTSEESRAALREKVLEVLYGDLIGPVQAADAAIAVVLEEAARLTDAQSQVFRDEAHNQKVWGDTAMSKRALSIAHHFAQHAAAIRGLIKTD
jgi:hypothetical protein